jgi:hypothetical protein
MHTSIDFYKITQFAKNYIGIIELTSSLSGFLRNCLSCFSQLLFTLFFQDRLL